MKYFIGLFLLLFGSVAFATPFSDVVDFNYITIIEQQLPIWAEISTKSALQIFSILWCFETFHQVIFKNVLVNNMKQLPVYIVTRVLFAGFFATCLLKPDFYLGVIQYFGSKTTGITFDGNIIHGWDVGNIFKQFKVWNDNVYSPKMDKLNILTDGGLVITYGIMYIMYLVESVGIALLIIILKVEIYLVVFGAMVLTGFAGSGWTYNIWNKYLETVIGLGVRVMVFGMLYGLLKSIITIDPATASSVDIVTSTIGISMTTACLWFIPNQIAGMVSGLAAGSVHGKVEGALNKMATGSSNNGGNGGGKGSETYGKIKDKVSGGGDKSSSKNNGIDTKLSGDYVNRTPPVKPMPPEFLDRNKGK